MRKTIALAALTLGLTFIAAPAVGSDAPTGPAHVGTIVTNGGCYTDAERAAMTDAELDAIGPNPDSCTWAPAPVGQVATGCEGDSCATASAPVAHRAGKAHHKRAHVRHSRRN